MRRLGKIIAWILPIAILTNVTLGAAVAGWAYLSEEDARDGEVLARFKQRNLAATTAAELFQTVIDESAKASYGADSKTPKQVELDSLVANARKGGKGKGGKGSRGGSDDDDDATLRPQASPVTLTPNTSPATVVPITSRPIAPTTNAPQLAPVTASPIFPSVPVVRTTSSPIGRGKGKKKSKYSDNDDDDDGDSSPSKTSRPASAPSEKGTRVFSKSEKKREKGSNACQDFEFDVDRRHRRHLQFGGAGCSQNALELASRVPDFSRFVDLVEAAGLEFIFDCSGPFTILVPSNAALSNLDVNTLSADQLRGVLLNHILPGVFLQDDFGVGSIEALNGLDIDVSVNPLRFNGVLATSTDNIACNGVLHAVDALLVDDPSPDFCSALVFDSIGSGRDCSPSLVDVARQDSSLSLVVALIEQAGLSQFLACAGSFTVLLPTNDAIFALGTDILAQLQDPANFDVLRSLLLYHVIPGRAASDTIQSGQIATLLDGAPLVATLNPLLLDNTLVASPDNPFCNGIYHVIDGVVIPPATPSAGSPTPLPTIQPTSNTVFNCDSFDFGGTNIGCDPNVLAQANTNRDLSLAVSLFELAGLSDIFDCAGQFTLLLPVNGRLTYFSGNPAHISPDAFVSLGQDRIEEFLLPQNIVVLRDILLAHVLPGNTVAADFSAGELDTLSPSGKTVVVSLDPLGFNGTDVVSADSIACNGVVHSIQAILTDLPSPPPSAAPLTRVLVDRFYISYRTTVTTTPTTQHFAANRLATSEYYENIFTTKYANFRGIDMDLDFTLFGDDVIEPAERYNLYMEFGQAVFFFDNSAGIPTSDELFEALEDGITTDYLLEVVRTQSGPFANVVEGFLKYVL